MLGRILNRRPKENILLAIIVAGFLFLPFFTLAKDVSEISSEEIDQHLQMSSKKSEALMHTLIQVLTDEMIDQYSSPDSNAKERAVPMILKKGVQVEALNYLLVDAPARVGYKIVKGATEAARLIFAEDISVIISKLEKKSAEEAAEIGKEWLFRKQIKTAPGTIEVEYEGRNRNQQTVLFQYVLIYKPISQDKGKLAVRIYSPNKIKPPKSKGGVYIGTPNDLKKPLPPFTVTINGIVEEISHGVYNWTEQPNIKIEFPEHVPDLGIEPLSFWERNLLKPMEGSVKEIKVLVAQASDSNLFKKSKQAAKSAKEKMANSMNNFKDWAKNTGDTVKETASNAWSDVKSGISQINPLEASLTEEKSPSGQQTSSIPTQNYNYRPAVAEEDKKWDQEWGIIDQEEITEEDLGQALQKEEQEESEQEKQKQDKQQKEQEKEACVAINEASKERLQEITGIGPATADKIINLRSSEQFYSFSDLTKISGIGSVTVNKIQKQGLACIQIEKEPKEEQKEEQKKKESLDQCVALNEASEERLQEITGVGPVMANRIVNFRKTGDFHSISDLDQISGIGPATVSDIESQGLACIQIEGESEQKAQEEQEQEETDACNVNINTASEQELQKITGIGPTYAERIVDNRNFTSLDELTEVKGIGEVTLEKIKEQDCAYVEDDIELNTSYSGGGGVSDSSNEESSEVTNGSMVINEIMRNPEVVSDSKGEWFELYNATDDKIDLSHCVIKDKDNDSHTIDPLTVATSGYAVLARSASSSEADYIYSGFTLANFSDEIILSCSGTEIDKVEYGQDFPFEAGTSAILAEPGLDNNQASNWCISTSSYSQGGLGTPGTKNDTCPVNQEPNASFTFSPVSQEEVTFDASASSDPDGEIINYRWNFGGEIATSSKATTTHSFSTTSTTTVALTVTDNQGATSSTSTKVKVEEVDTEEIEFADGVVISEVKAAGNKEFVELYNASSSAIEISSWYLSYFSQGSDWNDPWVNTNQTFPTTTIDPDNHYLIGVGDYGNSEPKSDWNAWGYSLKDEAGSVGIFTQNPNIATTSSTSTAEAVAKAKEFKIDAVGWGNATVIEGQAASAADKSLARLVAATSGAIKYIDTNDNANDFKNATPRPGKVTPNEYSDLDEDGIIDECDATTTISASTSLPAGEHSFKDLVVEEQGKLTLNSSTSTGFGGVKINADALEVKSGGEITADGKGFAADKGPGTGEPEEGAGYGGNGGNNDNSGYGSSTEPTQLGSGGGGYTDSVAPGGAGGGAIWLDTNKLVVNGAISANGKDGESGDSTNSYGGGGSGGSIYIETAEITGSGTIQANGGDGAEVSSGAAAGGGAGGRIAIHYSTSTYNFSSNIQAFGGKGSTNGGAGTIFKKKISHATGNLIINNNDYLGASTLLNKEDFRKIRIAGKVNVILPEELTVSNLFLSKNSQIKSATSATSSKINSGEIIINDGSDWQGNFDVSADNFTLASSSVVSANGQGFGREEGPGRGKEICGGAGFGGRGESCGSNSSGATYGFYQNPSSLGSGGAYGGGSSVTGGSGGGKLKLDVKEELEVNGILSANGKDGDDISGDGDCGGGSGGSILIETNDWKGSGLIVANGGVGFGDGGSGAGGRIAVYYKNKSFATNSVKAQGGKEESGESAGGAGTLFLKDTEQSSSSLIIDNNGGNKTDTVLGEVDSDNLRVLNGAQVILPEELDIDGSLRTEEGVVVKSATNSTTSEVTAEEIEIKHNSEWQGNFDISANSLLLDSSSVISADGEGFPEEKGRGAGKDGAGAGHGRFGGGSEKLRGTPYDSTSSPTMLGSGGGRDRGGAGGGILQLDVNNLSLNGTLSANGKRGKKHIGYSELPHGGGGSGGSIFIEANNLTGSGEIKANGGDGYNEKKGAGAGGRIAAHFSTSSFATSSVEVKPGDGNDAAESGTIFWGDGLLE